MENMIIYAWSLDKFCANIMLKQENTYFESCAVDLDVAIWAVFAGVA